MTEEQIALAKRAVACKGFRWLPGMADHWGRRLREGDWLDPTAALPDLTDPATVGCLLALVREAWGNKIVCKTGDGWFEIETYNRGWNSQSTKSFVAALVAALEAAP